MHCDVHYYPAKFEIKIQLVYGETKKTLYEGVIQTLAILEGSKLNFFPKKLDSYAQANHE